MFKLTLILENLINLALVASFVLLIFDIQLNKSVNQRMIIGLYLKYFIFYDLLSAAIFKFLILLNLYFSYKIINKAG